MTNFSTAAIVVGAIAIFAAINWLAMRRRTAAFKNLSERRGFHFLGEALPRSLSLVGTPMERATATWNTIDGEQAGVRIVAFDCRMGEGKGSWRRTVIGAQTSDDVFGTSISNLPMTTDRSNGWILLYLPSGEAFLSGLMSIEELDAYLSGIRR